MSSSAPEQQNEVLAKSCSRMCLMVGFLVGMVIQFSDPLPMLLLGKSIGEEAHDTATNPHYPGILMIKVIWSVLAIFVGAFLLCYFEYLVRMTFEQAIQNTEDKAALLAKFRVSAENHSVMGAVLGLFVSGLFTSLVLELPIGPNCYGSVSVLFIDFFVVKILRFFKCYSANEEGVEEEGEEETGHEYARLV